MDPNPYKAPDALGDEPPPPRPRMRWAKLRYALLAMLCRTIFVGQYGSKLLGYYDDRGFAIVLGSPFVGLAVYLMWAATKYFVARKSSLPTL